MLEKPVDSNALSAFQIIIDKSETDTCKFN